MCFILKIKVKHKRKEFGIVRRKELIEQNERIFTSYTYFTTKTWKHSPKKKNLRKKICFCT